MQKPTLIFYPIFNIYANFLTSNFCKKKKKRFGKAGNFQKVLFCIFLHMNIYLIAILYYYILSDLYIIAEDVTFISL